MKVDLESCEVVDKKIICDLEDRFHQKRKIHIPTRDSGVIKDGDEEFFVEAAPYFDGNIGVSIPIAPGLPSSPYIDLGGGLSLPFTILPLPKKWVDRMGDKWLPSPIELGPEDKFESPLLPGPTPK